MKRLLITTIMITATTIVASGLTQLALACPCYGKLRAVSGFVACTDSANYTYINTTDGNLWAMWNVPQFKNNDNVIVIINDNNTDNDLTDDYIYNVIKIDWNNGARNIISCTIIFILQQRVC